MAQGEGYPPSPPLWTHMPKGDRRPYGWDFGPHFKNTRGQQDITMDCNKLKNSSKIFLILYCIYLKKHTFM